MVRCTIGSYLLEAVEEIACRHTALAGYLKLKYFEQGVGGGDVEMRFVNYEPAGLNVTLLRQLKAYVGL